MRYTTPSSLLPWTTTPWASNLAIDRNWGVMDEVSHGGAQFLTTTQVTGETMADLPAAAFSRMICLYLIGRLNEKSLLAASESLANIYIWQIGEPLSIQKISETRPSKVDAKNEPRLSVRIVSAFSNAKLDDDATECAARARDEAVGFADREIPFARPAVDVSEDGVVTLQWRGGDSGVMLVFIGDGTLAYSVKNADSTYGAGVRELPITNVLPKTLRAAIEQLDPEAGSDRAITPMS
jgi:hypothetical protein